MMDDQEKKEPASNKIDPFTAFMFGKPAFKDDSSHKEETGQEPQDNHDWLFGRKSRNESRKEEKNVIHDLLNGIDAEKLMENVDLLLETTQEIKPLLKKISPFLDKWKK